MKPLAFGKAHSFLQLCQDRFRRRDSFLSEHSRCRDYHGIVARIISESRWRITPSRCFTFLIVGIVLAASSAACSRTADISGTIFVTMKSGDIKRGADVEVALIARTEKLETDTARALKENEEEYAKTKAAVEAAEQQLSSVGYDSLFYRD